MRPGKLPAIIKVAPNSPSARAKASRAPATIPRDASGSETRKNPANCDNLRALIDLNHFQNWAVVQKAVMDTPGRLKFAGRAAGDPTAHVLRDGEHADDARDVEATTIDQLRAEFGPPALIKMDIEGAELHALAGVAQTLAAPDRPKWLIEMHSDDAGVRGRLYDLNPLTHFIEIVRMPIVEGQLPIHSLQVCIVFTAVCTAIAAYLLGRFRRQIVFLL